MEDGLTAKSQSKVHEVTFERRQRQERLQNGVHVTRVAQIRKPARDVTTNSVTTFRGQLLQGNGSLPKTWGGEVSIFDRCWWVGF